MFNRFIQLSLPEGQAAFLWGARQTGKTTLLGQRFPRAAVINLLNTDLLIELMRRPAVLRERVLAQQEKEGTSFWIIDEVQKVPALLDEVHLLIEEHKIQFLLCGSSARKLKHGHANLLGGRAWKFELFPLVSREIEDFDLLKALRFGLLPRHYLSTDPKKDIRSYLSTYLKEEIRDEGLTRNLPAFSRFLECTAYCCGEILNYSSIARDVGIDAKTVREFFQITVDTHVGVLVAPWHKRGGRESIQSAPKFYWFDVGIENAICAREFPELRGDAAGDAFETFMLMELRAAISYLEVDYNINYWRTKSRLEVDFILSKGKTVIALEVQISTRLDREDYKGLVAFSEEIPCQKLIVVCHEAVARLVEIQNQKGQKIQIHILPWAMFLKELWTGNIFSL